MLWIVYCCSAVWPVLNIHNLEPESHPSVQQVSEALAKVIVGNLVTGKPVSKY